MGKSICNRTFRSTTLTCLICILVLTLISVHLDRFLNDERKNFVATTRCSDEIASSLLYDNAIEDSEGFFDDIENSIWQRQRDHARSETIFRSNSNPDYGINDIPRWMLNNVDPIFTCQHEVRVGGRGDGAKWACDPYRFHKRDDCLIYSVGSAGNYQFEDGLVKLLGKHCEIHVFDPNPKFQRTFDNVTKNIHYHSWGLKSSYQPRTFGKFHTIEEIMLELGHVGRRIDLFKIDCEGCEWTSYKDWVNDTVDIRQILIEIHPHLAVKNNVSVSDFFQALLHRGFVPFSKEANTHPAAKPAGTLFEYGFVRLRPSFLMKS